MSQGLQKNDFRQMIERGDVEGVRRALENDSALANTSIRWYLNQDNETDPLHFVSDCVGQGWLTNGTEGQIATLLLEFGADINGSAGRESPLIAAASLGAEQVARVLIEAGAQLETTSLFGAGALHWAAWSGQSATVQLLIARGLNLELKDTEFSATPLFWAVHGYGEEHPKRLADQVSAARLLIEAGAAIYTTNKKGVTALELANSYPRRDMYELLVRLGR